MFSALSHDRSIEFFWTSAVKLVTLLGLITVHTALTVISAVTFEKSLSHDNSYPFLLINGYSAASPDFTFSVLTILPRSLNVTVYLFVSDGLTMIVVLRHRYHCPSLSILH